MNIFVVNHAASRMVRTELIKELQQHCDPLASIDLEEFSPLMEKVAMEFEYQFLQLFNAENLSTAPKVPVFDFTPTVA